MMGSHTCILFILINYFVIVIADDEFLKHQFNHNDKNTRNKNILDTFGLTSVSLLGRYHFEEKANRNQASKAPLVREMSLSNEEEESEEEFDDTDEYYSYYDYEYDSSETDNARADRSKRETNNKAHNPTSKNVVFGRLNITAYPWTVHIKTFIKKTGTYKCGGSLISSRYVVTAAHCLNHNVRSLDDIHITLETYNYLRDSEEYHSIGKLEYINNVELFPEEVIIHPDFDANWTLKHDIALIRLRGSASNLETIRPIPLPTFDINDSHNNGLEMYVAGWGSVSEDGPYSNVKQEIIVNLVPLAECRRMIRVCGGKMCAVGTKGRDACSGNSGGPLMAYDRGNYFLAGIVSGKSAYAKCGTGVPIAYTNVYQYLRWIQQNMRP